VYSLAELRTGHAIELEGTPYLVLSAQFSRKSQAKANCVTKLKNLKSGAIVQKTFMGNERITPAEVEFRHVQFLFADRGTFTFMDLTTYEQFSLPEELVRGGQQYLTEGGELDVLLFEEKPLALRLPVTVDLKVLETTPGVRGDTATGGTKPATLETGLTVQVPLFVEEGDIVRVNTERGEYVERIS
jgi:elongation factor P